MQTDIKHHSPTRADLPPGWQVRPLLSTVRIASGQVDPRIEPYRSMTLIAPDHIEVSSGRILKRQTANEQHAISGKYVFKPGDIVYSKIRPYLRKAALVDFAGLCSADMYPLTSASDVSARFMLAVLLGERFSQFAESVSARSGIPKINREELGQFVVHLPSKPEQELIAQALGDMDRLIECLESLIAKKHDIIRGSAQQLLTGRTRLLGPTQDWKAVHLHDVGVWLKGRGITGGDVSNSGVPCIRYGEIYTTYSDYAVDLKTRIPNVVALAALPIRYGDICFAASGETAEEIGKAVAYLGNESAFAGGDIVVLRPGPDHSPEFISRMVNHGDVAQRRARLGQGDAVVHISTRNLGSLELVVPELTEQQAIASVLHDMDAEIANLRARLQKLRAIRQGVMQQLLSGRVRLALPEMA